MIFDPYLSFWGMLIQQTFSVKHAPCKVAFVKKSQKASVAAD
jgi:hypothetical protein